MKPTKSQRSDIKKILKAKGRGALIASVTGAGKTLVGVEAALQSGAECVLIVGPVNTFTGWARTLAAQDNGRKLRQIGNYTPMTKRAMYDLKLGEPGWYFAGWEWLAVRAEYHKFQMDAVIFDEIHRMSTRGTKTQLMGYAVGRRVEGRRGLRVGLSATPFGNKLEGAWAVRKALWPQDTIDRYGTGYHRWANAHLTTEEVRTDGGQVMTTPQGTPITRVTGEIKPGIIVKDMPLYIRHEARERCCKHHPEGIQAHLPPRVTHQVGVSLTPGQRKIYTDLETWMLAFIEDSEWPIETQGYPMVQMLRLLQVCLAVPTTEMLQKLGELNPSTGEREVHEWVKVNYPLDTKSTKLDAMMDILTDIDPTEPVLIFTHSRGIIDATTHRINKKFGAGTAVPWHGGVSKKDRPGLIDQFGTGKKGRIIVAQAASVAEGTDGLQTRCANEIWLSLTNNNLINTQAMGRLLREGQTRTVNSWEIYAEDTVELDQYNRLVTTGGTMRKALKA